MVSAEQVKTLRAGGGSSNLVVAAQAGMGGVHHRDHRRDFRIHQTEATHCAWTKVKARARKTLPWARLTFCRLVNSDAKVKKSIEELFEQVKVDVLELLHDITESAP
ncbi:hypothetical protein ACFS07_17755 [Undibacterium arcticum]